MHLRSVSLGGALSVALSASALSQAPALSVRHHLAGDALIGAATGDQKTPAIAPGAGGFLVAWSDRRAQLSTNSGASETAHDIWFQRLSAGGTPLDPTPTPVAFLPGEDVAPRVTWGGSSWLVSWSSQAPLGTIYGATIVGMRISSGGALLDPAPFPILGASGAAVTSHAAASDGTQWVVVSGESTSGLSDVSAVRVSSSGQVLDPVPVALFPAQWVGGIDVAAVPGVFLITWSRWFNDRMDDVLGQRFGPNLAALDAAPFAIASSTWSETGARCAANGSAFLVSWSRSLSSTYQGEAQAARVTSGGAVLDAPPIALTGNKPFLSGAVQPAWDGAQWYVAWTYDGIEMTRVSAGGSVLDFGGFEFRPGLPATHADPRLAGSPLGGAQMVWTDDRAGSYEGLDVYGTRIVDAANQGSDAVVSTGASAQVGADLASDGVNSALVYQSESSGGRRILVSRLDGAGMPLDAQPIEIANDPAATHPTIAWNGSLYLVAWTGPTSTSPSSTVQVRRMQADGTLLDATPVAVGTGTSPDVAGRNGDFLIAYTRAVAYPLQQFPVVALVRGSDGVLLAGPTLLNSNYAVQVDTCATPNGFVVAWQRNYWNNDPHSDVWFALVDASGLASAPVNVAGSFNWYHGDIRAATSGNEVLFVWREGTGSNLTRRLNARRVDLAGAFLDAAAIRVVSGLAAEQFNPALAFDGTQYVTVFQDLRGATSMLDQESDVFGARILPSGVVRDPQGFGIERTDRSECRPAIVGLGGSRALMATSILRAEAPFASFRVATRTFEGDCVPPSAYCSAKQNSLGLFPQIGSLGTPGIGANDLVVTLAGGVPGAPAMAIRSSTPAAIPAFQALLCVGPAILRGPIVFLGPSGSGYVNVPLLPEDLGTERCYQWWSRDVAHPDGTGVSLSNALRFAICP